MCINEYFCGLVIASCISNVIILGSIIIRCFYTPPVNAEANPLNILANIDNVGLYIPFDNQYNPNNPLVPFVPPCNEKPVELAPVSHANSITTSPVVPLLHCLNVFPFSICICGLAE